MAGIFPQYDGVNTRISTPNSPNAPKDPRPEQIYGLGAALERSTAQVNDAYKRRQELEDEAKVMQRYMQAVGELDAQQDELQLPENALQAKSLYDQRVTEREPEWYKGLSQNAQAKLQQRLWPKQLEYRGAAGKTEHRAKIEDYAATGVKAQQAYVEKESRRISPTDASTTDEFKAYADYLDAGYRANLIPKDKVEEMKAEALRNGAYNRAYKLTATDSQEEARRQLDLFKKEAAEPGSTYLKHIPAKERTSLETQMQEHLRTLRAEELRQKREGEHDTDRQLAQMQKSTNTMAAQKLENPEKYGPLTKDWIDMAGTLGLLDRTEMDHFTAQITKDEIAGTRHGDAIALNRYSVEVYATETPEQARRLRDELKRDIADRKIPAGPGSIASVWMNHLEEKAKDPDLAAKTPAAKTAAIKQLLHEDLKITAAPGVFQTSNPVLAEALRKMEDNAQAGYTKDPWQLYQEILPEAQARIGRPATTRANELSRATGVPTGPATDKKVDDAIDQQHRQLKAAYQRATTDAERERVAEAYQKLEDLKNLRKKMKEQDANRAQSRGAQQGSSSSSQQSSGGGSGPVPGPRR